jgi:hypothetical protein
MALAGLFALLKLTNSLTPFAFFFYAICTCLGILYKSFGEDIIKYIGPKYKGAKR